MNETKAEGIFDEAKGKIKQAWGDATGDQSTANSGAVDEVKGHAEQAWGHTKETASDLAEEKKADADVETEHTSHGLREDITNAAEHLKEKINHGLDNLKNKS